MKRAVVIGGVPGTGKTTLMRNFMSGDKGNFKEFRKLVNGHEYENLIILGNYSDDNEVFAGPDKYSMAVQPEAIKFLEENQKNILFEGDRLFTGSFLQELVLKYYTLVLIIEPNETLIQQRYKDRGSNQSETFINGRKTKVENVSKHPDITKNVRFIQNNVREDLDINKKIISDFLETGTIDKNLKKVEMLSLEDLF